MRLDPRKDDMKTQTVTVRVSKVDNRTGYGIFPTGSIAFRHPKTREETWIAMRPTLAGVSVGDRVEIDWQDMGGFYDAIKGARIAR